MPNPIKKAAKAVATAPIKGLEGIGHLIEHAIEKHGAEIVAAVIQQAIMDLAEPKAPRK